MLSGRIGTWGETLIKLHNNKTNNDNNICNGLNKSNTVKIVLAMSTTIINSMS